MCICIYVSQNKHVSNADDPAVVVVVVVRRRTEPTAHPGHMI